MAQSNKGSYEESINYENNCSLETPCYSSRRDVRRPQSEKCPLQGAKENYTLSLIKSLHRLVRSLGGTRSSLRTAQSDNPVILAWVCHDPSAVALRDA